MGALHKWQPNTDILHCDPCKPYWTTLPLQSPVDPNRFLHYKQHQWCVHKGMLFHSVPGHRLVVPSELYP